MKKIGIVGWLVVLGVALPVNGSAQVAGADSAGVHVVRPGDTLWDLARQYLADPYLWPEIFAVNRASVGNPNLIFPQARLIIPGLMRAVAGAPVGGFGPSRSGAGDPVEPSRTVFFPSRQAQARSASTLRMTPPSEVPVVTSGEFFAAGELVPSVEVAAVGRLVDVISPTVVSRSAPPQIQPYDQVHLAVAGSGVAVGQRVQLVRPGREVQPYGTIFVPTGSAVVLRVEAGVATAEVDRFYDQVGIGDLVVPMPRYDVPLGVTPAPAGGLEGQLLAFRSMEPIASTDDLGYVNLGAASGVVVGDEFVAYLPAVQEEWGLRPELEIARLQVVRVSRATSAVRVVALTQPALEEGLPVRLAARMP